MAWSGPQPQEQSAEPAAYLTGDNAPTDMKQHGTEAPHLLPSLSVLLLVPESNPSFAQFLPAGADRGTQRREESIIGEQLA